MKKQILFTAVIAALLHTSANAKVVHIKLEDKDGRAIPNALIVVKNSSISTYSDSQGHAILDAPAGVHTLDVKAGNQAHFHHQIEIKEDTTSDSESPLIISLETEAGHKIVINANPLEHTALDMATPIILLSGEELITKRAGTLGEILQLEPGLSVSSFGPAVSRPVIRGLSGARVKITNNQMSVQDASTTSADHDVGIEPLLIEQIEVVKGPATLLYGSGAIGGIVNTTDRKINSDLIDGVTGGIEIRAANSATGEQSAVIALDGGTDNWNWHIDGYSTTTDDLTIPGSAESEALHALEEAEEIAHEEEHEEEVVGVLENSASETKGASLGTTFLTENGYWGFSVSHIDKNYGVPGHAEHHEEEPLILDAHEEEHAHEEDGVSIDMSQNRYDIQTKIEQPFKGIDSFFAGIAYTDYQHQEIEGDELGTKFTNKAAEIRSYIKHDAWNDWHGVIGVQFSTRDFSAIGEEAIVPPSETKNSAIFWLEEKEYGDLKWELGARFESQSIKVEEFSDQSENGFSFSSGIVYSLAEHNKLAVNISHATRFPSVEEYYSFGPHLATQSFEIGNSNLQKETSNNIDFSYRFEFDKVTGEFNLFMNRFNDFIFSENVLHSDPCLTPESIEEAVAHELLLMCYKQQDAEYKGLELQMEFPIAQFDGHEIRMGLFGDLVRADLRDGGNLPRIPASKAGLSINYDYLDFSSDLTWVRYQAQNRIGENELATAGFDQVDLEFAYRMVFESDELFLFLKGKNLLDEDARDHGSFIKDLAPRVGRNFVMGLRYTF